MSVRDAVETATDASIYGYPLIAFATVRRQQTHAAEADAERAPTGQRIKLRNDMTVDNHFRHATHAHDHLSSRPEFLANRYIKERSLACN